MDLTQFSNIKKYEKKMEFEANGGFGTEQIYILPRPKDSHNFSKSFIIDRKNDINYDKNIKYDTIIYIIISIFKTSYGR